MGDALVEHKLIEGEESQYGLMVLKVNGMTADYDIDQTYWAFYQNGEYMMSGVDSTAIVCGEYFEIVHSKYYAKCRKKERARSVAPRYC